MLSSRLAPAAATAATRSSTAAAVVRSSSTRAMATKRKAVNIGTHSGTFHCDEALGCWMLKQTELFAGECAAKCGVRPATVAAAAAGGGC